MANRFASGKNAIAMCDRCGQRYKLKELKTEVVKTKRVNVLVCPQCWDPDQPQLQLGMYPVDDPQGLRNPRPDSTYVTAGIGPDGYVTGGSRDIQWGWNPVGGARFFDVGLTPNDLVSQAQVGTVTVVTT
jgi:hypothetical protein